MTTGMRSYQYNAKQVNQLCQFIFHKTTCMCCDMYHIEYSVPFCDYQSTVYIHIMSQKNTLWLTRLATLILPINGLILH